VEQTYVLVQVAFLAALGAVVGSFLNVCIDRLPQGASVLAPGSSCSSCHHPLGWRDLVPVVSFLWLRGHCKYCKAPIPRRLLLVEVLSSAIFALAAVAYSGTLFPQGAVFLLYASLLLVIFFIDLERQLVLDLLVYPALPIALLLAPWGPPGTDAPLAMGYWNAFIGGVFSALLFAGLYLAARGGMGFGDVKLSLLLGLMLGFPLILVAVPLGFIAGGAVAVVLLAAKRRTMKSPVPFAPFLAGASLVAMLGGTALMEWYLGLFG